MEKQSDEFLKDITSLLSTIEEDTTVPKNIRQKVKNVMCILLDNNSALSIRIDRSIEELGDIADDPNLPPYTKMQVWGIVSQLESY